MELRYGNLYVCKQLRKYNYLVMHGFKPKQISYDMKNPDKLIWIFENSEALEAAVDKYYTEYKPTVNY